MSVDDSSEDSVEALREHCQTISSIQAALESLTFLDQDTREAEFIVHEHLNDELYEMRRTINAVESKLKRAENPPEPVDEEELEREVDELETELEGELSDE
jgi:vacuolar-type H+-ATPase subunit I/STV1